MTDDARFRGERLQIMLTPDELVLIDDFRFRERMPSRAAAVRELLTRDSRRRATHQPKLACTQINLQSKGTGGQPTVHSSGSNRLGFAKRNFGHSTVNTSS